jgi:hypothetical protein
LVEWAPIACIDAQSMETWYTGPTLVLDHVPRFKFVATGLCLGETRQVPGETLHEESKDHR